MNALTAVGSGLVHGWLADLSQAATGSLLAAVWQGLLLAGAAALGLRLLPKTPAAIRFAIWFGVFLLVAALPMLSLWPHAAVASQTGKHGPWLILDPRWSVVIAALWALASAWRAGELVVAAVRVRALWKRARPIATTAGSFGKLRTGSSTAQSADATCSAQGGSSSLGAAGTGGRQAVICISDEIDRPTVIGFFSPKILIPEWLLDKLTPAELEQVLLHESGHLGRADDWVNLLQKIALVIFPLNPALAWVEQRLCFERELAVDERVLQATGAPKAYAACLATMAEHRLQRRGLALMLGALGRESELGRRVGRILRRDQPMNPAHAKLVLGGAVLGLLVAATALERCPQVVGFAAAGQAETAGNREVGIGNRELAGVFRAQAVMLRVSAAGASEWKPVGDAPAIVATGSTKSNIRKMSQVKDEVVDGTARAVDISSKAEPVQTNRAPGSSGERMTQAAAAASEQTEQGGDVVLTQWTVVTSWGDGTRTVLTTARISNGAPQVEQDTDAPQQQQQEVPRYAAVPVRGGWLIVQL